MGLFKKKSILLLDVKFLFSGKEENHNIAKKHSELKPIEFVYFAVYQFAKVAYVVPDISSDLLYTFESLSKMQESEISKLCNELLSELRAMNTDDPEFTNKYISRLYFKNQIERNLQTKIPLKLSQNMLIRTIPYSILLAYNQSNELEKEILKTGITFQANTYKQTDDYRNMRGLLDIPLASIQYGFDNRNIEV